MRAYRQLPCQNCGADDGTVCGAHANWAEYGKGKSIKASDDKCASLCHRCHSALDQGSSMTRDERKTLWERAHRRTMDELISRSWSDRKLRATLETAGIVR